MQISGIEQELVCGNNNLGSHFDTVLSLVNDSAINDSDRCGYLIKLRCCVKVLRQGTAV